VRISRFVAVLRQLPAEKDVDMTVNPPIETVILGLGRAGWDIHWRQLLKGNLAYRVTAAIDPVGQRRREAEQGIGCRTYSNLAEFLADPCAELVIIATPSGGHAAEGLACLNAGFHVVIDKPMCQTVAEVDALIAAARANGRVLTSYHPYRYSPELQVMRDVIRAGRLGRLVEIKCNRSDFRRRNDWVMRRAPGGGMHNVWGAHIIDQALQLADSPPRDVFSDLQCTVTPGDADDHCKILVRCANGVLIDAEISDCMAFPPRPEWLIAGTCGGLVTEDGGVRVKCFDPQAAPPIAIVDGPAPDRRYDNDELLPWQEEVISLPATRGSAAFYDNLAVAIRQNAPLDITPESVRDTIAVLETCRRQNPQIWGG
jgi:predicted dehydrogenase